MAAFVASNTSQNRTISFEFVDNRSDLILDIVIIAFYDICRVMRSSGKSLH